MHLINIGPQVPAEQLRFDVAGETITYKYLYKSISYAMIGSGGVIRNYNRRKYQEIFFDSAR
jgi:hypothetical protein